MTKAVKAKAVAKAKVKPAVIKLGKATDNTLSSDAQAKHIRRQINRRNKTGRISQVQTRDFHCMGKTV